MFLRSEIRPGAYCDSIVLLQLQTALSDLPGVAGAGAVMATEANLAVLEAGGLKPEDAAPRPDDLLVVVKAESEAEAEGALGQVDALLARRRAVADDEYRPKSLEAAVKILPEARWVSVSVPGRYAAGVAERALDLGRHVFLYSDNVALDAEIGLKEKARERGLLVMGPDCGTAIIAGTGLGFSNRVRRGRVGIVAASGTGLQAVASRLHAAGAGVSQAIGTGGRDLKAEVGAVTARQGLEVMARDPRTEVIVLISKPPAPEVARRLLNLAQESGTPVVVDFLGYPAPARRLGHLHFAASLAEAAQLAVELLEAFDGDETAVLPAAENSGPNYLRGLFAGGTLAQEALLGLRAFLDPLASNLVVDGVTPLDDPARSRGHTVLDLGDDAYTVGRLHPMIDQTLRLARLRQEAADPEVGMILLDVVLGDGAHPDPAAELAPVIEEIRSRREVEVLAVVLGTDEDPQDLKSQIERLRQAGARIFRETSDAVAWFHRRYRGPAADDFPAVDPAGFEAPLAVINVGLESFYQSLDAQGAGCVHVEWRPPAGGNESLMAILEKMRAR